MKMRYDGRMKNSGGKGNTKERNDSINRINRKKRERERRDSFRISSRRNDDNFIRRYR